MRRDLFSAATLPAVRSPRFAVLLLSVFACVARLSAADPRGDAPDAKLLPPEESRARFHLPPGFEILSEDLERAVSDGTLQRFTLAGRQVILYVPAFTPDKPFVVDYRVRARFPLRAATGSARAYEYYNPDHAGLAGIVSAEDPAAALAAAVDAGTATVTGDRAAVDRFLGNLDTFWLMFPIVTP